MSKRARKLLIFVAIALTAAALISLAQSRFPPASGEAGGQRALLLPAPR